MLHVVSDGTSAKMPSAPLGLRPRFEADFDTNSDLTWLEYLDRETTRLHCLTELKSSDAWTCYKVKGASDSDLRKRLERGISQACLIIVDPTVRAAAQAVRLPVNTPAGLQYNQLCVLTQLLVYDTPLFDLTTKEVSLPGGIGIGTEHIGNWINPSGVLDPHKLLVKAGRRKNRNPNKPLSEDKVLRFAGQLTSALIDIRHPTVWHKEEQGDTRNYGDHILRRRAILPIDLYNSCLRNKWYDDGIIDALKPVLTAIAEDCDLITRNFYPHRETTGVRAGGFNDFASAPSAPTTDYWRLASDIAAGFAHNWYLECPATDPVQKARWLASIFSRVVYNGHLLIA